MPVPAPFIGIVAVGYILYTPTCLTAFHSGATSPPTATVQLQRDSIASDVQDKLYAAAVAAAGALNLADFPPVRSQKRAKSVLGWLDQHGEHSLTSLKMTEFPQTLLQLPCPNLLELSLGEYCTVQLAPSAAADGSPGVIQGCSKLTRLQLECNFSRARTDTPVLDCLSSLVDLQHLVMSPVDRNSKGLAGSTLLAFPHLTSLSTRCMEVGFLDNLAHSSNLLELSVLPSPPEITLGPLKMPALELPVSLTKLSLLCRIEAGLLSLAPETLRGLYMDGGVEGDADALLSGIARLQHLTVLLLDSVEDVDWPDPGPAYNSLTASSSLVSLGLEELNLPEGVIPYLFPATHKLWHLTSVCIQDSVEAPPADDTPTWSPTDLSSLIDCCPNLSELERLYIQVWPRGGGEGRGGRVCRHRKCIQPIHPPSKVVTVGS